MPLFDKHPDFIVRSESPFNGGPPTDLLCQSFITSAELFYVRNHGTIPELDPARYRLTIGGLVARPLTLSLGELKNDFPRRTLTVTLECAGNRRKELMAIAPIPGETPWGSEGIGNANWAGIALRDVLEKCGIAENARYVEFIGADDCEREGKDFGFGGSIPIEKAMHPEVLLAYEMNGEPLEPIHGFPLRVVTPGFIGARSVKWLARINVQAESSSNYFQAHAYQIFPPHVKAATADWSKGLQLGELNVNSVICEPSDGARVRLALSGAEGSNRVRVRGYAMSGGRGIARVEVTTDRAANWIIADSSDGDDLWAWRLWQARVELTAGQNEIAVRAWDSAGNTQPEDAKKIWNFKGYMNNAWHRVNVYVESA